MKFPLPRSQIGLSLITLGAAFLFWFSVRQIFSHAGSVAAYGLAAACFTFWLAGLALVSLFAKSRGLFVVLAAVTILSSVAFFGLPAGLAPGGIVLILALLYALASALVGRRWMRDDAESRLAPRYFHTLQIGLPRLISPVLLLAAALFYLFTPATVANNLINFSLPRPVFDAIAAPLEGVFPIGSLGSGLNFNGGPDAGGQVNDALFAAVSKSLKDLLQPYKTEIAILVAVGLFLTLRAIASPYTALLIEFTLLIFHGLVKFRIIERRTVQREQVTYQFK